MSAEALRSLAEVHAALAWGAVIAAIAAAVALGLRRGGGAALAVAAAALAVATFVTGAKMHGPFQARLRQKLFLSSTALGWLFERKEHAAFGALALSLCGAIALLAERWARRAGGETAVPLRRAGLLAIGAAALFELFALGVSIAAAGRVHF